MYSVHLINSKGEGSYLSVKGRSEWKTKATAKKHADDIRAVIAKGRNIFDAVCVDVENEFGEILG